jgi:hypothetical protein
MASKNKTTKKRSLVVMGNLELVDQEYTATDQYKALVDDCKSARTEMIYSWKTDFIIMHGVIGQRVFTDPLYGKFKKGNFEFIGRRARISK